MELSALRIRIGGVDMLLPSWILFSEFHSMELTSAFTLLVITPSRLASGNISSLMP